MQRKTRAARTNKTRQGLQQKDTSTADQKASLRAYHALLHADHWLLVAGTAVSTVGAHRERGKLEAIRKSVAARLEHLQQEAYEALGNR